MNYPSLFSVYEFWADNFDYLSQRFGKHATARIIKLLHSACYIALAGWNKYNSDKCVASERSEDK